MKRHSFLLVLFIFAFLFSHTTQADIKIKVGGSLESNLFVGLNPNVAEDSGKGLGTLYNYRNSNSLNLNLKVKTEDGLSGKAGFMIRNLNFSPAMGSSDLEDYNRLFPVSFRLNELYIDFNEMAEWFELRVGQQRIAWGKATAFNPTDNINPYNLENPLDFTAKLPVPAIKMNFILTDELSLTVVGIPFFVPSILPISLFREVTAVSIPLPLPENTTVGRIDSVENLAMPGYHVRNTQAAVKFSGDFEKISFSASYFWGRLNIPVPNEGVIAKVPEFRDDPDNKGHRFVDVSIEANLLYPRVHIVGFDFSTELGGVGIWGEFALVIPTEEVKLNIRGKGEKQDALPIIIDKMLKDNNYQASTQLATTPYPKVTVGMDYTFKGGWYFNLQYVHGFFNEQTLSALNHYIFLIFRKSFLRGKMILQLTTGGELDMLDDEEKKSRKLETSTAMAFLVNPEIQFKPFDASLISIGGIVARGHTGTTLSLFQDLDQVYLRFKFMY